MELNTLHRAVLSGTDVVVVTKGRLESVARSAAHAAGRLADLRVVHAFGPPAPPMRMGPDSLGPPRPAFAPALGASVGGPSMPPADPATLSTQAGILVIHLPQDFIPPACADILLGIADACRDGLRTPPLLFADMGPNGIPSPAARAYPWTTRRSCPSLGPHVTVSHGAASAQALDRAPGDAVPAPAADGAERGSRRDVAFVRTRDRIVLARRGRRRFDGRGAPEGIPSFVDVFEIGPDGYCHGLTLSPSAVADTPLDAIADMAWRGGLPHLAHPPFDGLEAPCARLARLPDPFPERSVLSHVAFPDVLDLVQDRADLPLSVAVSAAAPRAQSILRAVAAAPPGAPHRRDFAMTWPAFAHVLLHPDLVAEIDRGGRTLPLVCRVAGVTPAVARRLVGRARMPGLCRVPPTDAKTGVPLGDFLNAIGHDNLPPAGDARGWEDFLLCCIDLQRILNRARLDSVWAADCARLLVGHGGTWGGRRQAYAPGMGAQGDMQVDDAGDMVRALSDWLGHLVEDDCHTWDAFSLLSRHGSMRRLVRASVAWHADVRLHAPLGVPDDVSWPVPFDRVDLGDGWFAVALRDPRELREEGSPGPDRNGVPGLSHCAAGYARACLTGASLLVSLRRATEGAERRVSTAEFRPNPEGFFPFGQARYELVQHLSHANGPVSRSTLKAMANLHRMLSAGGIAIDESALAPRDGLPPGVSEREAGLALYDAWTALLPSSVAGLPPEDLVRVGVTGTLPPRDGDA